jgi:hypothetical protein
MLCPACRNPCLDSDLRCPHCQHSLVSTEPESQLSPPAVCGLVFAAMGAGTVALALPDNLAVDQFALAGVGAIVGGAIGAVIGIIIDRYKKKPGDARNPSAPMDGTAVG